MPFVRKKVVKGRTYYYLVESYRDENGKVRQRVIAYLSEHDTVASAFAYWSLEARTTKDAERKQQARDMVRKLKPYAG